MGTFHLINFGCRASQADGAAIKRQLILGGFQEARPEECEVTVINTCTVTAAADAEARQVIRRLHRENPAGRILVTGCYAQRASEEIAKLPGVAWVVGNSHKHSVAEILLREVGRAAPPKHSSIPAELGASPGIPLPILAPSNSRAKILVGEIGDVFHFVPASGDDRTRPTLKVQDGCNARCAFCVIPHVRGESRSLEPGKVIEQIRELEGEGYQEIVLSGINLGSYGRDLEPRLNFLGLLEQILAETSIPRLRISSIEPMDVTHALIGLVASEQRLAKHFHVPLQSGCNRILRLMNRRYWTTQYAERILAIHEQIPGCGLGADVMTGFPGETEADQVESLRFIESLPFNYLHIFPYSARPGTPAAANFPAVDGRRIHERARQMRCLITAKRRKFLAAQVGKALSVLTLHQAEEGMRSALSSNYLKVCVPSRGTGPNQLLDVRVGRVDGGQLVGYQAS